MVTTQTNPQLLTPHGRLRFLRSLTGLTRASIEHKYHLPEITLKKWETGTLALSAKGMTRCLAIYHNEGIAVTESWLANGVGVLPSFLASLPTNLYTNEKDLEYFHKEYSNCIAHQIEDDKMLPQYKPLDIVLGFITQQDITKYNNIDCIIQFEDGKILLRKMLISENNKLFLCCTNPNYQQKLVLLETSITLATPVRWHKIHCE